MFENKEQLSIRQWQKVALARAFLRDYQLIVLDEPTSALDPKAEYEVFQQFRQLLNGQSAILITHRLSEGGVWGAIKAIAFRQRSSQP
jgi:ATP-binding cassette subfamily B protein